MNRNFFGDWYVKKRPFKIEKNPNFQFSDKLWLKIPKEVREEIVKESNRRFAQEISFMFYFFVIIFFMILINLIW